MKQLLAFGILFLHLFGNVSFAQAKDHGHLPAAKTVTGPAVTAIGLHYTDAAELTHSLPASISAYKIREHRPAPALLRSDAFAERPAHAFRQAATEYVSLSHLSHLRMLLFPKHYFW